MEIFWVGLGVGIATFGWLAGMALLIYVDRKF